MRAWLDDALERLYKEMYEKKKKDHSTIESERKSAVSGTMTLSNANNIMLDAHHTLSNQSPQRAHIWRL